MRGKGTGNGVGRLTGFDDRAHGDGFRRVPTETFRRGTGPEWCRDDAFADAHLAPPSTMAFPAAIGLGDLDGANGFTLTGIDGGDRAGVSVSSAGDFNGDGFADVIVGARRGDPAGGENAGEAYVVFGKAGGFDASLSLADLDGANGFRLDGEAENFNTGRAVSSAGDVNGDGLDDILIGADNGDRTYVVFGTAAPLGASIDLAGLDGSDGFVVVGGQRQGQFVASTGDVNGDGIDDIIVGAPIDDLVSDPNDIGRSFVVFGRTDGFDAEINVRFLDGSDGFEIAGIAGGDQAARTSSAGDFNGDGIDDLLVGAPLADPDGRNRAGESYLIFGTADGFSSSFDLETLDGSNGFTIAGLAADDRLGEAVASAGDINGDGFDDIVIGAFVASGANGSQTGKSFVIFGRAGSPGAAFDLATLDGSNGFVIEGESAGDQSGLSVSSAGDVNGDGFADIIIGAHRADALGGASYVIFGKAGGFDALIDLGALDGSDGFRIGGIDANDQSGLSVSSAGDVNGDGFGDLIIGAPGNDNSDPAFAGESYVIFGAAPDEAVTRTGTHAGQTLAGGAFDDVLIGKNGDDRLFGNGGRDTLGGGRDDDTLFGGADDDRLDGGAGRDSLEGGSGDDRLFDRGGGDTLAGGTGDDLYLVFGPGTTIIENADEGIDAIRAKTEVVMAVNVENLTMLGGKDLTATGNGLDNDMTGNSGSNLLIGLAGNDFLAGRAGEDTLDGRAGNDTLRGDRGADNLDGGSGDDVLFGDKGLDTLTGGSGADVFTFLDDSQFDTITDFEDGIDLIRLSDYRQENGGNKLTIDQLLITQQGAETRIQLDLDMNGIADKIDLDGDGSNDGWSVTLLDTDAGTITAADFVF